MAAEEGGGGGGGEEEEEAAEDGQGGGGGRVGGGSGGGGHSGLYYSVVFSDMQGAEEDGDGFPKDLELDRLGINFFYFIGMEYIDKQPVPRV